MQINEVVSKQKMVIIYGGGFHPFNGNHFATYQYLVKKFPSADIYVAASNDTSKRPFPFEAKKFFAELCGVPADKFVQVRNPYKPNEILSHYDAANTILLYAVGEKDKDRFGNGVKEDGSASYIQSYNGKCLPMDKNAYCIAVPDEMKNGVSGTKIRDTYKSLDDDGRQKMIQSLYPKASDKSEQMAKSLFDKYLGESSAGATTAGAIASISSFGKKIPPGQFFGGDMANSIYSPIKKNRKKRKK